MKLNFFSFFLTEEEGFLTFNSNLFETNIFNLLLLFGLLFYGYQVAFSQVLEKRQQEIVQTIEKAQQDLLIASNYYSLIEKSFTQNFFWFQSWKMFYQQEKLDLLENKYNQVQKGLFDNFSTTENLINNLEKKTFLTLQKSIVFLTASRILRKFLILSDTEQSKLIEITIAKLGEKSK